MKSTGISFQDYYSKLASLYSLIIILQSPTFSPFLHNYLSTPDGIRFLLLQPSGTLFLSLRDTINSEISSLFYIQNN